MPLTNEMESPVARSPRILVVDDNDANRSLARDALESEGYDVDLASGGLEGVEMFERLRPDCVLLDVRMPDLDGLAACERMRALPHGPSTPILIVTALRDVETFDKALLAGGDDFLTKPVRPTELVVRVRSALKLRRMSLALGEHYELLKQQRDDLLRLQLQKERLTAFIVHDLKNPVNTMDLYAQLLLRDDSLSATSRDSATRIRAEARQLNRMILNLLDVAKADEGQLSPRKTEVDLPKLLETILSELELTAQAHGVRLESQVRAERVFADEDLLRRTVTNLVENAIRYAPPSSNVSVTADHLASGVEIRVADRGRGVPAELRERIFDPFTQVDLGGQQAARASRGLGLTFCKRAVEAHGGTICVGDGDPGAVFSVTLPDHG